jgi:hypothetical protein
MGQEPSVPSPPSPPPLHLPPPPVSLNDVAQDLLKTKFFRQIARWSRSPQFGQPEYAIGGEFVDFQLTIPPDTVLELHQIVLGPSSLLFFDLFQLTGGTGDVLCFPFVFPLPGLLTRLIEFFYVLTNPEIRDLDRFLAKAHFGDINCHILLISTLSYIGEIHLLPRVQNSLREMWNPGRQPGGFEPIRPFFDEIKFAFAPSSDAPECVHAAFTRMDDLMKYFLSHWNDRAIPPPFVNAFAKVHSSVSAVSLVDTSRGSYGQISDLSNFFAACHSISNWGEDGSFPPRGFIDPSFNISGISKYVVQSWYPIFYDWVLDLDTQMLGRRQHVVVGSPGIGKSSFGLYFMSRLIASGKSTFCGHSYFAFSWRMPKATGDRNFRISLITGEVVPISTEEYQSYQGVRVFHLLDGHSYTGEDVGPPCLSIISPSQMMKWKMRPEIRYAPSLDTYQLSKLSGISTLFGFNTGDPEIKGFPSAEFGTIETRMKIVGGHLRYLFSPVPLDELKEELREALDKFGPDLLGREIEEYFSVGRQGEVWIFHSLFACYSDHPFNKRGKIRPLSPWVELQLNDRIFVIEDHKKAKQIAEKQNWLSDFFGLHFTEGSVHGNLFEDGCHVKFEAEVGQHHLELVTWQPKCSQNLRDHKIEQIEIPVLKRSKLENNAIPDTINNTWYWVAPSGFTGVDAIYCHSGVVYILQMTISLARGPVSLRDVDAVLAEFQKRGATLTFVTLVDLRTRQWAFQKRKAGMLQANSWWSDIRQTIGVLCFGPPSNAVADLSVVKPVLVDE